VRVLVVADDILAVLYAGSRTSSQEFTADFKHHLGRLIVTFNGVSAEKLEYFFGVHHNRLWNRRALVSFDRKTPSHIPALIKGLLDLYFNGVGDDSFGKFDFLRPWQFLRWKLNLRFILKFKLD